MATILDPIITVHSTPGEFATFPSLQRHARGELFITYRHAPDLMNGTYTHIDVRSTAWLKKSTDSGHTWLPVGDPVCGHLPQSGIQDPSLTILSDDAFLLTYFHWRHQPDHPQARQGAISEGVWVRRSDDQGLTWDEPVHVPPPSVRSMGISEPAIELPDRSLLLAGYTALAPGGETAFISRSLDGGRSWSAPTPIAHDPTGMVDYEEPALLDLGGGHILCMMRAVDRHLVAGDLDPQVRSRGVTAYMWQSHSWDGGQSWESPVRTAMWGHPPSLIRLRDGRVLCTYGHRRAPYGIRACLSTDQGRSWEMDREVVLRTDGGGADIGYPSSVELADGTILTSYYFHTADQPTRRIEATRWRADG